MSTLTRLPELVINPNILAMEYAVRGPIPQRAAALRGQGRSTIPCNIGNPQALGQPPLAYFRQLLGLVEAGLLRRRRVALEHQRGADVEGGVEDAVVGRGAPDGGGRGDGGEQGQGAGTQPPERSGPAVASSR